MILAWASPFNIDFRTYVYDSDVDEPGISPADFHDTYQFDCHAHWCDSSQHSSKSVTYKLSWNPW